MAVETGVVEGADGARDVALRDSVAPVVERFEVVWRRRGMLLFLFDLAAVFSTFMLAYYLRYYTPIPVLYVKSVEVPWPYLKGAALLAVILCLLIWRDGGYDAGFLGVGAPMLRLRSIAMNTCYAIAFLMAISFMWRELLLSRQVYLMTGVMAFATMVLVRRLFQAVDSDLSAHGYASQRVAVVGLGDEVRPLVERLDSVTSTVRIVGWIRTRPEEVDEAGGRNVLGALADLREIHRTTPFDVLLLSPSVEDLMRESSEHELLADVLNFCESMSISLYTVPRSFDVAVSTREVSSFSGLPMIRLQDASLHPGYRLLKRLIDLAIAVVVLTVGLPLWLAIAAWVKLSDGGPVLFLQRRAGLHGAPFDMYKFRSMVVDAEARLKELVDVDQLSEPVFKIDNDPRVSRIGAFLRRTSLDEIPQLVNVVRGEMSVVGPRPEELRVVARYSNWQRRRLKAKPGITGYQQIHNRGEPDLGERIRFDLIYLKHQSLVLDLYILLRTVVVVVRGSGRTH